MQFEWAWQQPAKSRRIGRPVCTKKSRESALEHKLRILGHMLTVPPWYRLPLTLRWLRQEYEDQFHPLKQPPVHMPIAYGLVEMQYAIPPSIITDDINCCTQDDSSNSLKKLPVCWICRKVLLIR